MRDLNTDAGRRVNGNRPTTVLPHSEYEVYPNLGDDYELQRRRSTSNESAQRNKNVACERFKMNLIYFLIITIVALFGILAYTLVIVFEENSDVLEPVIDDVPEINLPIEQRTWYDDAIDELRDSMKFKQNKHKAKNIILFMGDGMGLSTVTASRIYKYGEEGRLSWESFPNFGLLKTYCVDKQVCDSASTATALFCGIKSNYETSGVDSSVKLGDCPASLDKSKHVDSILKWAQDAQMATGFVTTTRVVHATPSALYSHVANRRWECEAKMEPGDHEQGCKDIARQLIEDDPGRKINVIMGGGRQCLVSNVTDTKEDPVDRWACYSTDGRNLTRDWILDKEKRKLSHAVVSNNEQLENLDHKTADYVLGIFANGHLKYDHERGTGPKGMPSLTNMTEKALKVLKRNKNGFVLVVEGGMIDQAHHRGFARRALSEVAAMDETVKRTLEIMHSERDETLIIVTADHSHSLTINGYPPRGNNILGIARNSKIDGIPYTTLLYTTGGPNGFQVDLDSEGKVQRRNPSNEDTSGYTYIQQAAIKTDENAHAGSDVTIHATGPMAHLVQRVHEQSYVAHLISYAARIGRFRGL
ncbi:alkaline phosphatase-like [Sitodiplosis mosellana]|uniref:alkaline phosphatase-like n=1 Tax=Sitodiplosis mosellana TaxID=263140 RepID=UPI002444A278|nr:alkaline phosphatase-like [Sitodiplosis mosellana]XP_055316573.1 alkaline phosphatase-like [Sitodiplosis mosellana]XP_055316582.1 alkaline phosphatase-like [Sitodiplosis mosellana]XP_055316591.1 alkaline phosphatase-like [Sitodiplosis mosellana]XP_055316600.1 alkaline phosphatase-like [Sitodiplosis mosellana]XP_055316606.1 alkaline phosphatase-like [Sitodiplosis mosellana]XP_055316610.1 alkaline phosphatase-like [Sitodiplosis mosellana]XP_055316618.1 alkaline phosphatase-like [Sitodiplosi